MLVTRPSILVLGFALLGCGPAAPSEGTTAAEETAGDESAVPSPPIPWAEMDTDARRGWMVAEVLPRMGARFMAYDADRYADFSCATCHGPTAHDRDFAMPSLALPALPSTGSAEQHAMVREYEAMCRFMFSEVVPTMQTLLGAAPYDEATGEGFSCFSCHPRAGDEGATPIHLESVGTEADVDPSAVDAATGPE